MFDDEEAGKEEKDDEALQKLVGKGGEDTALKSEKGKENAKIDSATSAKTTPPTDEKPKEVASK